MEICSMLGLPDITDWWCQQEETHSKYADYSNEASNIFSILQHSVGVQASFSLGRDFTGWRQSKTAGETRWEKVIVTQFARANNKTLGGDYPALDTTETENDLELQNKAVDSKLQWIGMVHNFLEIWQGSKNSHATQTESCAQYTQVTAIGYILDMEEIGKATWSLFQYDGAAAFKLSERSPLLPALSAKELPGGQTQVINVHQIKKIDRQPVESDEDSTPAIISDAKNWVNMNGELDNPNAGEVNREADDESDIELDSGIEALLSPEKQVVSATPNVPRSIRPTQRSINQAEKRLMTVTAMETRRNSGNKRKLHRMGQYVFIWFYM